MEISLKVELTDEQYAQLMENSYDDIFKNETVVDGLREIIIKNFEQFFSGNSSNKYIGSPTAITGFVEKALIQELPGKSYGIREYVPTSLMRTIVEHATEEQVAQYEREIQQIVKDFFRRSDTIAKIIYDLILESIRAGISLGTNSMKEDRKADSDAIEWLKNAVMNMS